MRKTTQLLLLVPLLLVLISCQITYDFTGVEKQISQISKQYGTQWRKESINEATTQLKDIDKHIQQILQLKAAIQNRTEPDKNASIMLLNARISMLKSQKFFQQAKELDPRPLADIVLDGFQSKINGTVLQAFKCENKDKIIQATGLYQLALSSAHETINQLDALMQQYEFTRKIVGIKEQGEDNRPKFYTSPLGKIWTTIKVNNFLVGYCESSN
ncbi:hypothetical protein HY486_00135 [Candidatus Woesearchaeota archaeon]|nr:hypothetical protein [Candidatus Woesearchaeota archaeon]